jgi:hypothetical protein
MSTGSRGGASDSPAQAVTRKICQFEDEQVADKLREEQSVVNQDLSNRLDLVEQSANRDSGLEDAVATLGQRLDALEDLGPRLGSTEKLTEDLGRRISTIEQSVETNQATLTRIEEKMDRVAPAGEPSAPAGDPILEDTVKELRSHVNGLLERESAVRRQSLGSGTDHVKFADDVKAELAEPSVDTGTRSLRSRVKPTRVKQEPNTSDEEPDVTELEGFASTDNDSISHEKAKSFWERDIGPRFRTMSSIKPGSHADL